MSAPPRIKTGYVPHYLQEDFHRRMKRFNLFVCHRRWGKTVMAVNTLFDRAMRFHQTHPHLVNGNFGLVAPYRKQAKKNTWRIFKQYAGHIPGVKFNESELRIDLPNGSMIMLYGADDPDSIRGDYFDGVVLDEVAQMVPQVWTTVVRPMLTDRSGWILFIGTPKGMNLFSELYHKHVDDPNWTVESYDIDRSINHLPWGESVAARRAEVEMARTDMGANEFRQEYYCDFNASSDDTLITLDLVMAARNKHLSKDQYSFAPVILGVDVARFGDDRSCIVRRQGLASFEPMIFKDIDNMQLASRVCAAIDKYNADACFIDGGRGEGVIDRCRQLGYDVVEVKFGGQPTKDGFRNKRTEMWCDMKDWLEDGGALYDCQEMRKDLVVPTYDHDAAGRIQLESKKSMKKRMNRSPDVGDALALTFAQKVRPLEDRAAGRSARRSTTNDDYRVFG